MSGEAILLRRETLPGYRGASGQRVSVYAERSFHTGTEKVSADVSICKRVASVLYGAYPGHAWAVEVGEGLVKITIPALLGFNWGYFLHLDRMQKKDIVRAGGDILERFAIPRSGVDVAAYVEARKKVPMLGRFRPMNQALIPGGNIRCL